MESVAEKIRKAMKRRGFDTIKECAKVLDLPYELLRKVVGEDHIPKDAQLLVYAKKLLIDPDELLFVAYYQKAPAEFKRFFMQDVVAREALAIKNVIPVIGWSEVNDFIHAGRGLSTYSRAGHCINTSLSGDKLIALRVKDDSMKPLFQEGELVIVDPNLPAKPGDYVAVNWNTDKEANLKQLKKYMNVFVLHPLNPKYEDQEMASEARILGKVIRKQTDY